LVSWCVGVDAVVGWRGRSDGQAKGIVVGCSGRSGEPERTVTRRRAVMISIISLSCVKSCFGHQNSVILQRYSRIPNTYGENALATSWKGRLVCIERTVRAGRIDWGGIAKSSDQLVDITGLSGSAKLVVTRCQG
jgi:hypothetical protein